MEEWFIYACLSALFGGILGSVQKISIHRGISTVLVNSYNSLISGVIAFSIFAFQGSASPWSWFGFALVFISGGVYMYGTITRSRSMRHLDTCVVFPTYKSLTLLGTVIGGIFLFQDHLSILAWIGILIAISVPFLLVEGHEHHIKKWRSFGAHLHHAGWLLLYTGIFAGITSALLNKFAVDFFASMLLFTAASHLSGGVVGLVQQAYTHRGDWRKQFLDTRHPHSHLFLFSAVGGMAQCASFYCLLTALSMGQMSTTFAINSAYLIFPILFSIWYYHERFTLKRASAILFFIIAVLLLKW